MVDERVPGLVAVTPAQADAARAIVRRDSARGKVTDDAVHAVAEAKLILQGEFAHTRLEHSMAVVRQAMEAISQLDAQRAELVRSNPNAEAMLDAVFRQAVKQLTDTVASFSETSTHASTSPGDEVSE